jgi:hypothetical protein
MVGLFGRGYEVVHFLERVQTDYVDRAEGGWELVLLVVSRVI